MLVNSAAHWRVPRTNSIQLTLHEHSKHTRTFSHFTHTHARARISVVAKHLVAVCAHFVCSDFTYLVNTQNGRIVKCEKYTIFSLYSLALRNIVTFKNLSLTIGTDNANAYFCDDSFVFHPAFNFSEHRRAHTLIWSLECKVYG